MLKRQRRQRKKRRRTSRKRTTVNDVAAARNVESQLPLLDLLRRNLKSHAVRRSLVKAGGAPLRRAICSICKNIDAGNINVRGLTAKKRRRIARLAKRQRGGALDPVLPLISKAIPAVKSLLERFFSNR